MALIDDLATAIATFEGFFKPGSVAQRNNNPGNIRSWGSAPQAGGYAVFDSADAGWAALKRQIALNVGRGLTLREFFAGKPGVYAGYSPAADANDPNGYAQWVAARLGISVDAPLADVERQLNQASTAASGSIPLMPSFAPGERTELLLVAAALLVTASAVFLASA